MTDKLAGPLKVWHMIIALVLSIAAAGAAWGTSQAKVQDIRGDVDRLESIVERDHDTLIRIEQDVTWIREQLEN